jgi:hypothetical protein
MNSTRPSALLAVVNVLAGAVFVWSKAADRLWTALEPRMPWRTGPAWSAVFFYFAICAGGWLVLNVIVTRALRVRIGIEALMMRAAQFLVAACAIVILQVLLPNLWLMTAACALLPITLLHSPPARRRRAILEWACLVAAMEVAWWLIHPWFVGQPVFIPRLALTLTACRFVAMLFHLEPATMWTPDWLIVPPAARAAPPPTSA